MLQHHGKEIYMSRYTRELHLTFYEKKILHFYGYRKMILFRRLWVTPILVDNEIYCVGNIISLSFHAYKERLNRRSYTSCAFI
jgi:hypothetical protein